MRLTAEERIALHKALIDAFIDYDDLALMVVLAGHDLADIAPRQAKPVVVTRLIQFAETRDWVHDLVAAARAVNDTNLLLLQVAAAIGLEPSGVDVSEDASDRALSDVSGHLESVVGAGAGLLDAGTFASKLPQVSRRVCAIEMGGMVMATGFLIGPETVLTPYHVVQAQVDGKLNPAHLSLRFDYSQLRDGLAVNQGTSVQLHRDWLVGWRSYSADEAGGALPAVEDLDYAVLRTREKVGLTPPGGPSTAERGWLEPSPGLPDAASSAQLMVIGHARGQSLEISFASDAHPQLNDNGTRLRFRFESSPGHSGSPVLNAQLEVIGMFRASIPGSPPGSQAIPVAAIQSDLASRGMPWAFGSEAP